MPTPELFPKTGKLLEQHPRTRSLQPLHDLADFLGRSIRQEDVNMVACDFPGDDLQFMFRRNLADQFSHTKSDIACQNCFPKLRNPDHMYLQVALRMRT